MKPFVKPTPDFGVRHICIFKNISHPYQISRKEPATNMTQNLIFLDMFCRESVQRDIVFIGSCGWPTFKSKDFIGYGFQMNGQTDRHSYLLI